MQESFMSDLIPKEPEEKKETDSTILNDSMDTDFSISQFNNPGNIEAGIGFDGEIKGKGYGENKRFAKFATPQLGIRALKMDLTTKLKRFNGDLAAMINQYAPPSENDTGQYLKVVQQYAGIKDKYTETDINNITKGFIIMENKRELADKYIKLMES